MKACPVCRSRLVKFKDEQGRWFELCTRCGAQFPLESAFRNE